jgi:hypothetical protein
MGAVAMTNMERVIAEIEYLEYLYSLPDERVPGLRPEAAKMESPFTDTPWFQQWRREPS